MYNLKEVYGIITFDESKIIFGVFQSEKHVKHCLYYRSTAFNGTLKEMLNSSKQALSDFVKKQTIKIDDYLNIKVKRYLILIPHLKMEAVYKTTNDLQCKSKDELIQYINNIEVEPSKVVLSRKITDYTVNEQIQKSFPTGDFKANYIEYTALEKDVKDILSILKENNIEVLGLYNNATAYQNSMLDHNAKKRMLIDMHENNTSIVMYDENNDLISIQNIDQGKNWFINQLSCVLKLDKENTIRLIRSFKNIKLLDANATIANYHKGKWHNFIQLKISDFTEICKQTINHYFGKVVEQAQKIKAQSIHFNCDKYLFDCFKWCLNNKSGIIINNVNVEVAYQNILGLENENVSSIEWILNGAINEREALGKQIICSIDAYIDAGLQERQFSRDIFMKGCIFLTSFMSKLGLKGDQIWKKS